MVRNLLILLALLPSTLVAKSYGEFDVAPAPRWTDVVRAEYDVPIAKGLSRYGVYDILADHQVRVAKDGATTQYFRTVRKVLTSSGVQNASQLTIDFDPSFQRLILHEIAIVRGTRRVTALDPAAVRVIEKEDDSDSAIYDGRLTALIFLKDVRPGDVIEWSWSIDGANPILDGHYADEYDLRSELPSHHIRHRLIWDGAHALRTRGQIAVQSANTYVWEARDVEAVNLEDDLPSWYEPWDSVEVSDFASWNEVAQWAAGMFRPDAQSLDAVKALAEKIRREHADDPATAAIRFVQDDIRYLGLEIGRNSHEPRQPKEIVEQRWGDCKEKALLLSLLLRDLDYDASPALVNTKAKQRLDSHLPSPFAFDHVIVRVNWNNRAYWIDPTIADQGGSLQSIETPNDERALVVDANANDLTKIETIRRGRTVIDETYAAKDASSPTTLSVRTTYSGTDADAMRSELSSMAADEIARDRLNRYAADHPSITATAPPKVEDDRLHNVITISEHYAIRDLWNRGEWTYVPRDIEPSLDRPKTIIRSMPLAFDYPLDIVQRATFRFPAGAEIEVENAYARKTAAFIFAYRPTERDRSVTLEYSLRSLRDSIPPGDISRHLTAINDINEEMGCAVRPMFGTVQMRLMGTPAQSASKWLLFVAIAIVLGGLTLLRIWKLSVAS